MKLRLILILLGAFFIGCGGGGGSSDGMLIEGTLTQGTTAGHEKTVAPKHGEGQRIENVAVCALDQCSTTDGQGQWGFVTPDTFTGGDILFFITGHGIDTKTPVSIPAGTKEVSLDFEHRGDGSVAAEHITIDGVTSHHEDDADNHE